MLIDLLTLPFFQRALLAGLLLAPLMALLGTIVVLRRLSFFSDAIGHASLAGIAVALLIGINPFLGAVVFALLVASLIAFARTKTDLHLDTLLGVIFPAAVAFGVIIIQLTPGYQTDLIAFLFGDILTISSLDLGVSALLAAVVVSVILLNAKQQILIAFNKELAHAEGINVTRQETLFLILLAAVVALAIKLVGIILVTALLVIPAATGQNLAKSLKQMTAISIGVSLFSVAVGMLTSATLNLPSGPTIVLTAAIIFGLSFIPKFLQK